MFNRNGQQQRKRKRERRPQGHRPRVEHGAGYCRQERQRAQARRRPRIEYGAGHRQRARAALGRALARRHPGARTASSTPELVSQRKGRGGKFFDYLEGHAVIDQANRIFGYGGWGYELVGDVTLRQHRDPRLPDRRGEGRPSATAPPCASPSRALYPAPTSASTRWPRTTSTATTPR